MIKLVSKTPLQHKNQQQQQQPNKPEDITESTTASVAQPSTGKDQQHHHHPNNDLITTFAWQVIARFHGIYEFDLTMSTIQSWPWPYLTMEQSFLFRCFPWTLRIPTFLNTELEMRELKRKQQCNDCEMTTNVATESSIADINDNEDDDDDDDLFNYFPVEYITHRIKVADGSTILPLMQINQYCLRCISYKLEKLGMLEGASVETQVYGMLVCFEEMLKLYHDADNWCSHCIYTPLFKIC